MFFSGGASRVRADHVPGPETTLLCKR
jgi:hypothetical protein